MFKAQILGRLGRNANVCETAKGQQFLAMTMAVNAKVKGEDRVFWVDVCSFNPNHVKLAKYLTKGKIVQVGGDFSSGTMTDKIGVVRMTYSITADYISFINLGNSSNSNNSATTTQTQEISEPVAVNEETVSIKSNVVTDDDIVMNTPQPKVSTIEQVPVTVGVSADDDNESPF